MSRPLIIVIAIIAAALAVGGGAAFFFLYLGGEPPVGRELARHTYDGETYVLVEYGDELAVFAGSGSPVTNRDRADSVVHSYAWRQVVDDLDYAGIAKTVRSVQQVDSSISGTRSVSNRAVDIFDELDSIGANIPFRGRVSAMDVVKSAYPGLDSAERAIRSLNSELNRWSENTDKLVESTSLVAELSESGELEGDDLVRLFADAVSSAQGAANAVSTVKSGVSEAQSSASRLESALRDASDTPVIGGAIGGLASTAGRFESELGDLTSLLGDFESDLGLLRKQFEGSLATAATAREGFMSRWLAQPHDPQWPPTDPERRPAGISEMSTVATPRASGTAAVPAPTPTDSTGVQPPSTPSPVPLVKPPGYLNGAEHGIALIQSTRRPSQTREGWVDITLDLAVNRFGPDVQRALEIGYELKEGELCFENSVPPNDCVVVVWGSEEQVTAQFDDGGRATPLSVPLGSALLLPITFEVAGNATQASLLFGEHKVPVDLEGSSVPIEVHSEPVTIPQTANEQLLMPGGTRIAVLSVSSAPSPYQPTLNDVEVTVVVSANMDDDKVIVPKSGPTEEACFESGSGEECISVDWGPDAPHYKALTTFTPTDRLRQAVLSFQVPNGIERATLALGDRQGALDLKGMRADLTPSIHELSYPELAPGSVLYDVGRKRVVLESIDHDPVTGGMSLRLNATNNSEAADFAPVVTLKGSRVSASGVMFDGRLSSDHDSWDLLVVRVEGQKLPPGGSGQIDVSLPRRSFGDWRDTPYVLDRSERPDAVVLELAVSDRTVEAETPSVQAPAFVSFARDANEDRFWLPDLVVASIEWEPDVPTIGMDTRVEITVENRGQERSEQAQLAFKVDGETTGETGLGGIDAGESTTKRFEWRAEEGKSTFGASVDPENQIEEGDETNNETSIVFGGAFLPDLVVESITWEPTSPSIGDTVTFTVTIKNQGAGRSGSSYVHYFRDGSFGAEDYFDGIPAGESVAERFVWKVTEGTHTFMAAVDPMNEIVETDDSNNELSVTYGGTLLADLVVESITWEPTSPSIGDTVTFTVTIKNQGAGRSGSSYVHYFRDGSFGAEDYFDGIPAGESVAERFAWKVSEGTHTFMAAVDPMNEIVETDDSNNELSVTYGGTLLADLVVESITWEPTSPSIGDTVTFTVTIKNQGAGRSGSSYVHYFRDGSFGAEDYFDGIPAGESVAERFAWKVSEGTHTFMAAVDPMNEIVETDDSNNELSVTYPPVR